MTDAKKLPRHKFWGAGEPECPPELKAPNGELHTMRCKVCGDGWRESRDVCMAALGPPVPRYSGWLWTHVVKGGDYRMLGEAKLQTDKPLTDMAEVVVYQGADGKLWARERHEFEARFSRTRPDTAGVQACDQPKIQLGPEAFRFDSFPQWVNKAQGWFQTRISEPARSQHRYVAIDTTGRVCLIGADFMRARDAGTFPVVVYLIDVANGVNGTVASRAPDIRGVDEMDEPAGASAIEDRCPSCGIRYGYHLASCAALTAGVTESRPQTFSPRTFSQKTPPEDA